MFTFNPKKKYFNQMLKDLANVIYQQEFQRWKALAVREQLRREYDQANDAFARISAHPDQEAVKTEKDQIETRLNQIKGQMDDMDLRINGTTPNETHPEGVIGLTQKLESSVEMREYIRAFVKHNT